MRSLQILVGATFVLAAAAAARPRQGTPAPNAQASDSIRFVAHPEHIPPGFPSHDRPLALVNPLEGNANAKKIGSQLYVSYNCIDCHGADGSGAMGPSLADGRWRYGGADGEIFESIYYGRPHGMPAYGGIANTEAVWKLVTYVQSLQPPENVPTESWK